VADERERVDEREQRREFTEGEFGLLRIPSIASALETTLGGS
jgi:hypothetical protein